jgi:hypothetical protein
MHPFTKGGRSEQHIIHVQVKWGEEKRLRFLKGPKLLVIGRRWNECIFRAIGSFHAVKGYESTPVARLVFFSLWCLREKERGGKEGGEVVRWVVSVGGKGCEMV